MDYFFSLCCGLLDQVFLAGSYAMDESGKINAKDLPEPTRQAYSAEEKLYRRYRLVTAFISFISLYAFIHKILIPFVLKLTPLQNSPYAILDFWVIHPILFSYWLHKNTSNNRLSSFMAGLAIIYGVSEWFFVAGGHYAGWLAFSRLLSSTPLAIGAAYFMCMVRLQPVFRFAWFGVLFYMIFLFLLNPFPTPKVNEKQDKQTQFQIQTYQNWPTCGALELAVKPNSSLENSNHITIQECGFSPVAINFPTETLEIVNSLDSLMNLHLSIYRHSKLESKWNIPIKANSRVRAPKFQLEANEVAILYSDLNPKIGMVVFLSPDRTHSYQIKRKPLFVGEQNGF